VSRSALQDRLHPGAQPLSCQVPRERGAAHLRGRDRLYFRIYFALLAGLFLVASLFLGVWRWSASQHEREVFEAYAELATEVLPPSGAPAPAQQQALEGWARRLGVELTLYDGGGELIAHAGRVLPIPGPQQTQSGWLDFGSSTAALKLADGRWLVGHRSSLVPRQLSQVAGLLALIAFVVSMVAYPVVRRLTLRLERLQASVEALGAGDLKARVEACGSDEVARLAQSFNRAAARIEALVAAQKALLANASHELRSPLARIRMAIELAETQPGTSVRAELRKNIVELDQLIDEILLASRLEAGAADRPAGSELVDFTALVAEECARSDARFSGTQVELRGQSRLLRRLVRNLLENGRRYGGDSALEVLLSVPQSNTAQLDVCDRGPGIPEHLRERIFEPFFRAPGTREDDGGVGLGLALVRTIGQRHGGTVTCQARPGGGTCFTARFSLL
jgi:signal transduction histidine kinase